MSYVKAGYCKNKGGNRSVFVDIKSWFLNEAAKRADAIYKCL